MTSHVTSQVIHAGNCGMTERSNTTRCYNLYTVYGDVLTSAASNKRFPYEESSGTLLKTFLKIRK